MIKIQTQKIKIGRKVILNRVSLSVKDGQVLALLGKNGTGKSTLLNAITNHPEVSFTGIKELSEPVFMGFQKPVEVPEVTTIDLLCYLHFVSTQVQIDKEQFYSEYKDTLAELEIDSSMLERPLNTQLSGGENKRVELLQMTVVKPKTVLLDEIDTGLDLDAQIQVGNYLAKYVLKHKPAVIIVTHNMKFLNYFKITKAIVLTDGKISHIGNKSLIKQIEEKGFAKL